MASNGWYCEIREHLHSTEQEAEWCAELYEAWQEAMRELATYLREDAVEAHINKMFPEGTC